MRRADEDVALDLKGILAAIGRRLPFVVAVTAAVGIGTFAGLQMVSPKFEAETKLLIENREPPLSNNSSTPNDRTVVDAETVASQVQLLTSRDLARRVAEKNHLSDRAEFDGTERGALDGVLALVGIGRDKMRVSPEERVVDAFVERLKVYQVDGSRVITVLFRSTDRDLAATLANSVAEEYLTLQSEAKRRTSEDQTRWLGEEIEKLRVKVRDADEAVEKYRSTHDLLTGSNNTSVSRQQITDVTNAIAAARSDQAAAESKAKILAGLLRSGAALDDAADVLESDTFRSLRSRQIALRGRLSELLVTLLPAHPQVKAVESQIADVRAQETAEARRVLAALQNDAKVAAERIRSLQDSLGEIKVTSAADGASEVELKALERDAASQRNILDGLLARYREANARQNTDILPADARVISRAATPVEAAFPKVGSLTLVATLAGLLLSIAWVIAGEFLSGRALVRVAGPVERPRVVAGTPVEPALHDAEPVAKAPRRLRAAARAAAAAAEAAPEPVEPAATEAPAGAAADSVEPAVDARLARFRARVSAAAAAAEAEEDVAAPVAEVVPEPVAETPLPLVPLDGLHALLIGDGASRVAVMGVGSAVAVERVIDGMSRLATVEGTRVVVVDTVASHVGIGGAGLYDLLTGSADFSDIIRRNPQTRAHEIGVGSEVLATETWASADIETMLDALEHTYDLVVIDLGPMDADGARFRLVSAADHAILVGEPADPHTRRAHDMLRRHGVERLSVVAAPEFDVDAVA
ncbi:hypothetical protein GCM10007904_35990 [Oharaeibacter diazotrophicus]|nr:hypothetical protein GCM10007904_35990 [Oharaeibacter diazotrophicus]